MRWGNFRIKIITTALFLSAVAISVSAILYLLKQTFIIKSPSKSPIKSVQYMQPDANFKNFYNNLDILKVSTDFKLIESHGFNSVIIIIPWGEFQISIEPILYNKYNLKKLHKIIKLAAVNNLKVILKMGTHEVIPEGIKGGDFWAGAIFTSDKDFRAYYYLFKDIANATKRYSNILYFWTWEDTYLWPLPWYNNIEENQKAWISWCKNQNTSLEYWNNRWNEKNNNWSDIKPPDRREYSGDKKVGDFWAFNDTLINEIGIPVLARALKRGNPNALIGYEPRIDYDDGYNHKITFQFLQDYDFITSWYYPYKGLPLTHIAPAEEARKASKIMLLQFARAAEWSRKPVFMEQIGASSRPGLEEHQEKFLELSTNDLLRIGSMGYSIWSFQDYILNFVYNPSFEIWPGRWHGDSLPRRLNDKNKARSGRYFLMFSNGNKIRQKLHNIPLKANLSLMCHTNIDNATLNIRLTSYNEKDFVKNYIYTITPEKKYKEYKFNINLPKNVNNALLEIEALCPENKGHIILDNVKYFRGIDYMGLYDAEGNPKSVVKKLRIINKRNGTSLMSKLRLRFLYLLEQREMINVGMEVGKKPEHI